MNTDKTALLLIRVYLCSSVAVCFLVPPADSFRPLLSRGRKSHRIHLNQGECRALRIGDHRETPYIWDVGGRHADLAAELTGARGALITIGHGDIDHPVRRDSLPLSALHGQQAAHGNDGDAGAGPGSEE